MRAIPFILFILIVFVSSDITGQSYRKLYVTQDYQDSGYCGQTTTNYSPDRLSIDIIQNGNSPNGYRVIKSGSATVDGYVCDYDDSYTRSLSPTNSLCNIFEEYLSGCCEDIDVSFKIVPNYSIITPNPGTNNTVPQITLEMTPGYDPLVYKWEFFHPTTNNWTPFPAAFLGQSSITFDAEDLFGANASNFYGVSIQYRIALCNGWVPSGFPYIYSFIKESPQVTNVSISNTSCTYTEDGGFTVTFNRPLDSSTGELLTSLSLRSAGNDNILDTADDISPFQNITSTTYSSNQFTWPQQIPEGTYRLSYQSDGANSLVIYDPIIITSGPPLEYGITANDITCFNTDDGEIIITINPNNNGRIGTAPYKYIMNGGNEIPFSGTSTTIINLGTGLKTIKVFDSNNCTQRL
ncbi:hypothetical protein [Dokdonia sp. Hel_I_53]|uniref:hypothetical protein n=1 Tax=Dokdonia sp. Hel_I_53 TaxID=1566287 RepID=UPI00119A0E58|nr:hypothetical protein [Dokdonia sp. Hel_I_53]TVZ53365.1 hypothetical protein OD90_2571 [Dokdonia sp. Hel_I_53]